MMSPSCGPLPTLGHGRGCSGSVAAHTVGSRLVQCTAAILASSGSAPVREAASPKAERPGTRGQRRRRRTLDGVGCGGARACQVQLLNLAKFSCPRQVQLALPLPIDKAAN